MHCSTKFSVHWQPVILFVWTTVKASFKTVSACQVGAMLLAVNNNISHVQTGISGMERELEKLSQVMEVSFSEESRGIILFLPSTGERPAFNITKVQIELLRETAERTGKLSQGSLVCQRGLFIEELSTILTLVFQKKLALLLFLVESNGKIAWESFSILFINCLTIPEFVPWFVLPFAKNDAMLFYSKCLNCY